MMYSMEVAAQTQRESRFAEAEHDRMVHAARAEQGTAPAVARAPLIPGRPPADARRWGRLTHPDGRYTPASSASVLLSAAEGAGWLT